MVHWWPVTLTQGDLILRPLQRRDAKEYKEVRAYNREWLDPWEASLPEPDYQPLPFREVRSLLSEQAKNGQSLPFALTVHGKFRGQVTVSGMQWGSLRSAALGYWIDKRVAGHGYTPLAVAMAIDFAFFELGLHRMEINIRPENKPSLRVVEKLGFRDEGVRERFMHINGQWRDHRTFALVAEDVPQGLVNFYRRGNFTYL